MLVIFGLLLFYKYSKFLPRDLAFLKLNRLNQSLPVPENNKSIGMSGWKLEYQIVPVKEWNRLPAIGKAVKLTFALA